MLVNEPNIGTTPKPAPKPGTTEQKNALADLRSTLDMYGLGSLVDWAWNQIVQGASENQILLDLQQTPEFKQRFPAIEARRRQGLPPLSPGEYVTYEARATEMMRAAGLPKGFWDSPDDFTKLLTGDVSLNELQQRVTLAKQAAFGVPQDVRDHLARDYGIDAGHIAAAFLDPSRGEPLLERQFMASQIGAAGDRAGYGTSRADNERLTDLGVSADQAQQGFSTLANSRELFGSLPGENTTGISHDEQLAAVFEGNSDAQRKVKRRQEQRTAAFGGGGGFVGGAGGFSGVGSAQGA